MPTRLQSASSRYPGGSGPAIAAPGSYQGTFIPEIWSMKLLEKFYDATVLAGISNTDYEGEIRNQGDTVIIRQRPDITIRDYEPDAELLVERPNADTTQFMIEYAKYFNLVVDDVWATQADMDMMAMWSQDAAEQIKVDIDRQMMREVFLGGAIASNRGATAGRISESVNLGTTGSPRLVVPRDADPTAAAEIEVLDLIVDMGLVLDEQNIPENGRWIVLPAWMIAMLKKSDLRKANEMGDPNSVLRNGRVGRIDRFDIYSSNQLPQGTGAGLAAGEWSVFAGHNMAVTFATQINKLENMRSERTFGSLMRGLFVFGCDVINPIGLSQAIVARP